MTTDQVCRWGILGAASIARKNWKAIRNAEHCDLVAVASRDQQRARQFIAECQADAPFAQTPRVVASYEELLADPTIDAVYLPLPTIARKPWVIRAAEAGKHVLCEKPVGRDASEVQEILDACRRHQVQFMDGVNLLETHTYHGLDAPAVHSSARNSLAPENRPLAIPLPVFLRTP